MAYRVFFVEDEIVTREGIRDNVDWHTHGFELCGEAPDGEIALPQLQKSAPDVLITDIKMPFMDGLQLARIVRERMPKTKIVILSGHDEFEYAQQAIKLGVTEYLLKPVTVQNMHGVLCRLADELGRERDEAEALERLRQQVQESRAGLVERLWFKLLVGAISPAEAIDESELLSLDLTARCYLVVVIRVAPGNAHQGLEEYGQVHHLVAGVVGNDPDVSVLRKDLDEMVLIMKGSTPGYLVEARDVLIERILQQTPCRVEIGKGSLCERMTDIGQSFIDALADVETHARGTAVPASDWLKIDRSALADYLKCGVQAELDEFFDSFILPIGAGCHSSIVRNYLMLDIVFTTARLIHEWGGDADEVLPQLQHLEAVVANVTTIDEIKEHLQPILSEALAFRDAQSGGLHGGVVHQAREYIEQHYTDPEISLHVVASRVGHSPSHFCTVFSEATGRTFKAYLTDLRIKRAKELLRTSSLRTAEISDQVGYNDPHYFGLVFRKSTGLSPREFRLQSQAALR